MVDDPVFDGFLPKVLAAVTLEETRKTVKEANEYVARQHFSISFAAAEGAFPMPAVGERFQRSIRFGLGARRRTCHAKFLSAPVWIDLKLKQEMGAGNK